MYIVLKLFNLFAANGQAVLLWRHSFDFCDSKRVDPEKYLDQHLDMVVNGLAPAVRQEKKGVQPAKIISIEKKRRNG